MSLGHDEPPIKYTYTANEQRAQTYNLTAGLAGGKPSATAAYTYATTGFTATQAAEDMVCQKSMNLVYNNVKSFIQPSPRWVVKSQATDESWNSAIRSYSALNTKIYRWPRGSLPSANLAHDIQLDAVWYVSRGSRPNSESLFTPRSCFVCQCLQSFSYISG